MLYIGFIQPNVSVGISQGGHSLHGFYKQGTKLLRRTQISGKIKEIMSKAEWENWIPMYFNLLRGEVLPL